MPAQEREHLLSRGHLATRANDFLSKAWDRGWLPAPPLSPDALWQAASKGTTDPQSAEASGRTDADVADFRLRLERLCEAVQPEAQLNALGQAMAYGQLVRVIRNRLAFGEIWSARPELPQTKLAAPIIVIGHMRSGTTRIHKLLAADPAHSHTRYCDAFHPVPGKRVDLREWKSAIEIGFLCALNPWMQSIHPVASTAVEEELGWLAGALQASIYESQWHIPEFTAWNEARDATPIYREFARVLRTDAGYRGNADKPRVLKVPVFSENLPELLAQFPDARLIVAERDQSHVHRSAVSLVANQMAVQSDHCELERIEAEWHRKIALREDRREAALRDWNGPITRLTFEELNSDWEAAIERAYEELGLHLTPKALSEMRKVTAQSHKGAHHAHSAQLKAAQPT